MLSEAWRKISKEPERFQHPACLFFPGCQLKTDFPPQVCNQTRDPQQTCPPAIICISITLQQPTTKTHRCMFMCTGPWLTERARSKSSCSRTAKSCLDSHSTPPPCFLVRLNIPFYQRWLSAVFRHRLSLFGFLCALHLFRLHLLNGEGLN